MLTDEEKLGGQVLTVTKFGRMCPHLDTYIHMRPPPHTTPARPSKHNTAPGCVAPPSGPTGIGENYKRKKGQEKKRYPWIICDVMSDTAIVKHWHLVAIKCSTWRFLTGRYWDWARSKIFLKQYWHALFPPLLLKGSYLLIWLYGLGQWANLPKCWTIPLKWMFRKISL